MFPFCYFRVAKKRITVDILKILREVLPTAVPPPALVLSRKKKEKILTIFTECLY